MPSPGSTSQQKKTESGLAGQVLELRDLVVAYFKQETLGYLSGLGRWVAFGLGGAVLMIIGTVFLMLATLRGLQAEGDSALSGNLSWVPYVAGACVALVFAGACARGISRVDKRLESQGAKKP